MREIGSVGDEVTQLQTQLTANGVYFGPITGYFGPLTQAALKTFQAKYGISPTGVIDSPTMNQLNILSAGQVLGASTSAAVQTQIAYIKTELASLIQQLLTILQAQLNQALGR